MSTTLSTLREKLDEIIGEKKYSGTTSSAGASDYTTVVDSSLANYPDNFFANWYLYLVCDYETNELIEKRVKSFDSPSGTVTVWNPFETQIDAETCYTLSRFSIDEKVAAINRALVDSLPYFYNKVIGIIVGKHTSEKDNRKYVLADILGDTFAEIPDELYTQDYLQGTHDGMDRATVLTDSSQDWDTDELIGQVVYNKTDLSYGIITTNTSTTVTAILKGGTNGSWYTGDEYIIPKKELPQRLSNYETMMGDNASFYADVSDQKIILCIGRNRLTPLTYETDETELDTNEQAEIVALKGAVNLYKMALATIDSSDRADFEKQITTWENEWAYRIRERFMPPMGKIRIDWSWTR